MNDTVQTIKLKGKKITLVGTAHVSQASVVEVEEVIRKEKPDCVCVELDATRYKTLTQSNVWKNLDITKVLKERKGFLLLANIVLASFQRRLGLNVGVKPGEEMLKAIEVAKDLNIPCEFCDREVQVTLRRAWAKSSFWGKNKMLAALLASVFTKEKLTEEEMEKLKEKSLMHNMMEELANYLPSVKEVLIDERDRYLATKIFNTKGKNLVAIVGAGHLEGIIQNLKRLEKGEQANDIADIDVIPPKKTITKLIPWVVTVLVLGLIAAGVVLGGAEKGFNMAWTWFASNTIFTSLGAALALAHPLAILLAAVAAPFTSLIPVVGAGMVGGLVQYYIMRPKVRDFESLYSDLNTFKGFYKNRVLKIFWVFFLSGLGSMVGTWVGISLITSLLGAA
ncbi:MAG: TraB/GumN family protein [Spirochaetales bacterium]|nr:TraB/GumN family protein [Spirochaetales bacterium]